MKQPFLIAAALALPLAGCSLPFANPQPAEPEIVFCAQDVQACPDGTSVARDPANNCQFRSCGKPAQTQTMTDLYSMTPAQISALNPTFDAAAEQTRPVAAGDLVAKITTTKGDIWLRLFPELAPKTVENFVGLAERDYYDGIIFHRVIPDFMIQTGDPTGTGMGGESIWGQDFADEFTPKLTNIRGAVSMANRGPATNGSQFFIVQAESGTPWLDGRHSVFGQVFVGLDVVDAIATAQTGPMDKPVEELKMTDVQVFQIKES